VSEERFLACLAGAAAAAGADAQILFLRGAGPDHPVALECPETRYLKAVLLRMREGRAGPVKVGRGATR
jgi:23S rRNA (cytosine1962-C5)-methyltransferase